MPQDIILQKAKAAIRENQLAVIDDIFESAEEQPTSETTGKILCLAAHFGKWELACKIGQRDGENKADETAIGQALNYAFAANKLQEFKRICQESISTPNQDTLEDLLDKALRSSSEDKWSYIAYLCFDTKNKPGTASIDKTLEKAATYQKWELVLELLRIKEVNNPSKPAIAKVLKLAYEQNNFDRFVDICEQSTTPPSQETIEAMLDKAIRTGDKTRGNYISYLCFLTTDNKPKQTFIDSALVKAARYSEWDLVYKLIQMEGENKPHEKAIAEALHHAYDLKIDFSQFKTICEQSITPPSQESIEALLDKALKDSGEGKWSYIDYLCFYTKNKPGTAFIDKTLEKAATYQKWELALELLRIKEVNNPSKPAIAKVLKLAYEQNNFDRFVEICEQSSPPPSQKTIEAMLDKAIRTGDKTRWKYISYLCFLTNDNKPKQTFIDSALVKATRYSEWDLVYKLIQMKGENKPHEKAIAEALHHAHDLRAFSQFKTICEQSITPPSQESIEDLLDKALKDSAEGKWSYIDYLCFYTKNKPGTASIDKALCKSAMYSKWPLALKIFRIEGNNQPGQMGIEFLLEKAAQANKLELVQEICSLAANRRPSSASIGQGLIQAAKAGFLQIVRFFAEIKTDNKPLQSSFENAFIEAAEYSKVEILKYLSTLNVINQEVIGLALIAAAQANSIESICFLRDDEHKIQPTEDDTKKAFLEAVTCGNLETIAYFTQEVALEPQTIEDALLAIEHAPNRKELLECLKPNTNQPVQTAMQTVLSQPTNPEVALEPQTIQDTLLAIEHAPNRKEPLEYLKPDTNQPVQTAMQTVLSQPRNTKVDLFPAPNPVRTPKNNQVEENRVIPIHQPPIDPLQEIRNAVAKAQALYREWYKDKEGIKGIRGANGFFSHWCFRHGPSGQRRAKDLVNEINEPYIKTPRHAHNLVNHLLKDSATAYHRHSFASFLLDELRTIESGPWKAITLRESGHYEQDEVLEKLGQASSRIAYR